VPQPGRSEIESRLSIRKCTDHAGASPNLAQMRSRGLLVRTRLVRAARGLDVDDVKLAVRQIEALPSTASPSDGVRLDAPTPLRCPLKFGPLTPL
jgi:hypothetical protein